jgi:thiopurine S-methyltransferase
MEPQFWHDRWQLNEIGFHQEKAHPALSDYWPLAGLAQAQVFVPLCGKSLDMAWLRRQGHSILGIELSPLAVTDFFLFQGLTASTHLADGFQWYESSGFRLLCGDFFNLKPKHLQKVEAVYDRAALVALPPPLQARYAEHLLYLLPQRPPILMITFEYDEAEMAGPPFSVTEQRIEEWFGHAYSIEKLSAIDALDSQPGLKSRGLGSLLEKVYYLHISKPQTQPGHQDQAKSASNTIR